MQIHPLHFLGLPTEEEVSRPQRAPFFTYAILVVSMLMTVLFLKQPERMLNWAFTTLSPFEHHGFNLVTSLFIHGSYGHLISNGYFLLMCGDNVEDELGYWDFLMLFVLGGIAGHLASLWSGVPMISSGASGGISAILGYYAFAFPQNRFSLTLFPRWGSRWSSSFRPYTFTLPPLAFLLVFFVLEMKGVVMSQVLHQSDSVNHFAHLGGLALGVLFWACFPRRWPTRY